MLCVVSIEKYDPGEQENLVLKMFRLKNVLLLKWYTLKNQIFFKIRRVGPRWKDMVQENKTEYFNNIWPKEVRENVKKEVSAIF